MVLVHLPSFFFYIKRSVWSSINHNRKPPLKNRRSYSYGTVSPNMFTLLAFIFSLFWILFFFLCYPTLGFRSRCFIFFLRIQQSTSHRFIILLDPSQVIKRYALLISKPSFQQDSDKKRTRKNLSSGASVVSSGVKLAQDHHGASLFFCGFLRFEASSGSSQGKKNHIQVTLSRPTAI